MKKLFFAAIASFALCMNSFAAGPDEGMWLPMFIERLNYVDMQKMGLHLTAEELYSVNNNSLKDAVVSLGFFCTAEIISNEGLLLTNHHCGYESIQAHSTLDHDYLTNGFWAMSRADELQNNDLSAFFLVRMEDVTEKVTAELKDGMSPGDRESKVGEVSKRIEKKATEKGKYTAEVKSFFDGNEFYLFVYQEFKDVRLVGAPPSSVGKFGGDTDNWMWPRHTGDFSMFRIYTAPDGSPAEYSKDNVPLKPKYSLPISLKGVKKDDFTMIWGYPGTTDRFLTSYGVKLAIEESNPTVVKIRDTKLAVIREDMNANPAVKLMYSAKYAECSNYWKYFIGQTKGLQRNNVYEEKKDMESKFTEWVNADDKRKTKYGTALSDIAAGYEDMKKYNKSMKYLEEAALQGPEVIYFTFQFYSLYNTLKSTPDNKEAVKASADELKDKVKNYFKNYNLSTDKKLFAAMMKMYYDDVPKDQHPDFFAEVQGKKYKGDWKKYADMFYSKSIFVDQKKLEAFLANPTFKAVEKDPAIAAMSSVVKAYLSISGELGDIQTKINNGNRMFVAGLREMNPDKTYYPNANSSMRMTYGKVEDYIAADAVHYDYKTTLDGVMEKENPKDDEFIVPSKLKELFKAKDYGHYADENGKLPTCFITNNDITGGNSGSPVINGDGQLVGIAFDGNWEAMSSDIKYEPTVQRTIVVDIRYVLFMIDKYAGAKNLINEMRLAE